jgi:hypothetical protein
MSNVSILYQVMLLKSTFCAPSEQCIHLAASGLTVHFLPHSSGTNVSLTLSGLDEPLLHLHLNQMNRGGSAAVVLLRRILPLQLRRVRYGTCLPTQPWFDSQSSH